MIIIGKPLYNIADGIKFDSTGITPPPSNYDGLVIYKKENKKPKYFRYNKHKNPIKQKTSEEDLQLALSNIMYQCNLMELLGN